MPETAPLTSTQKSNLQRLLRMEAFDRERAYRAQSRDGSSFSSLADKGLVEKGDRAEEISRGLNGGSAYWRASIYWLTDKGRAMAESLA